MRQVLANRRWLALAVSSVMLPALAGCVAASPDGDASAPALQDIPIAGQRVFPESITSDHAGNLYVGSVAGTIYRVRAGSGVAEPWIVPNEQNGLASLFGVLADDGRGLLWVCSNPPLFEPVPNPPPATLKAFDLRTAALRHSYLFPTGKPIACNDIAIAEDGTTFATETASGRIFALAPRAQELSLFAEGEDLVGVDGIAFADDGTMYINNVRRNLVQRVNRGEGGSYEGLTDLALSQPVDGPDGLRPLGGNRFLQAEGTGGRVALVEVEGDRATITPVKEGLDSSAAVTRVGNIAYALEGKINYLIDPALRGQDPGTFTIRAFALPEGL